MTNLRQTIEVLHESQRSYERKSVDFGGRQLNLQAQGGCQQRSPLRDHIIDEHDLSNRAMG